MASSSRGVSSNLSLIDFAMDVSGGFSSIPRSDLKVTPLLSFFFFLCFFLFLGLLDNTFCLFNSLDPINIYCLDRRQ